MLNTMDKTRARESLKQRATEGDEFFLSLVERASEDDKRLEEGVAVRRDPQGKDRLPDMWQDDDPEEPALQARLRGEEGPADGAARGEGEGGGH